MNSDKDTTDRDIYRDTPLRFLGYANELGESFRSFIGTKWVNVSYGIATLYVLADTADKTTKTYRYHEEKPDRLKKTVFTASDTLLWQMLASVIIPGITINRICAVASYTLSKAGLQNPRRRNFIVTGVGLAAIPLIIKPIDRLVDRMLDHSLRKIDV